MVSEASVQQELRLEAERRSCPLLRNNSGAATDKTGRLVRYGLGNESAAVNKVFKSSDLIGIHPMRVTPDMVGQTVGVFFAVECKPPGWRRTPGDQRATAQQNFGDWVTRHGGIFRFATSVKDVWS